MLNKLRMLLLGLMVCVSPAAWAIDDKPLSNPELTKRYQSLTKLLRCVTCQNQTIAGSNAPVAANMRAAVREQLEAGQSDSEITAAMRAKFGDYVLYQPPLNSSNLLLWLGPFLLLIIGVAFALQQIRKRNTGAGTSKGNMPPMPNKQLSREQARQLLENKHDD